MKGFYSDRNTCWNCEHFDCEFICHNGRKVSNQWDYHRKYICNKKGISFDDSSGIVLDDSCHLFKNGINNARVNYGCVESDGNDAFRFTLLYAYSDEGDECGVDSDAL